MYTGGVHIYSQ